MAAPVYTTFLRTTSNPLTQPLTVQYRYDDVKFPVTVGAQIEPRHFDKAKGLVVGRLDAPELNEKVRAILTRLEKARANVESKKLEPTTDLVKAEYKRLLVVEPRHRKLTVLAEVARVGGYESEVEKWSAEVEILTAQLALAKTNLVEAQRRLGIYQEDSLVHWIDQFIKAKQAKRADSTMRAYTTVKNILNEYNPSLGVREVDQHVMEDFVNFLIAKPHRKYYNGKVKELQNSSVKRYHGLIKNVLNAYAGKLGLNYSYKDYKFDLDLALNTPVFFTPAELTALRTMPDLEEPQQRAVDIMLLMCATALRHCDVFFNPGKCLMKDDEGNDYISLRTQKDKKNVKIPLNDLSRSIVTKYPTGIPSMSDDWVIELIRPLCETIPSMCDEKGIEWNVTVKGKVVELSPRPKKWEKIGNHSGRRTGINTLLNAGVKPEKVIGITGHNDYKMMLRYVDKETGAHEEMEKVEAFKIKE